MLPPAHVLLRLRGSGVQEVSAACLDGAELYSLYGKVLHLVREGGEPQRLVNIEYSGLAATLWDRVEEPGDSGLRLLKNLLKSCERIDEVPSWLLSKHGMGAGAGEAPRTTDERSGSGGAGGGVGGGAGGGAVGAIAEKSETVDATSTDAAVLRPSGIEAQQDSTTSRRDDAGEDSWREADSAEEEQMERILQEMLPQETKQRLISLAERAKEVQEKGLAAGARHDGRGDAPEEAQDHAEGNNLAELLSALQKAILLNLRKSGPDWRARRAEAEAALNLRPGESLPGLSPGRAASAGIGGLQAKLSADPDDEERLRGPDVVMSALWSSPAVGRRPRAAEGDAAEGDAGKDAGGWEAQEEELPGEDDASDEESRDLARDLAELDAAYEQAAPTPRGVDEAEDDSSAQVSLEGLEPGAEPGAPPAHDSEGTGQGTGAGEAHAAGMAHTGSAVQGEGDPDRKDRSAADETVRSAAEEQPMAPRTTRCSETSGGDSSDETDDETTETSSGGWEGPGQLDESEQELEANQLFQDFAAAAETRARDPEPDEAMRAGASARAADQSNDESEAKPVAQHGKEARAGWQDNLGEEEEVGGEVRPSVFERLGLRPEATDAEIVEAFAKLREVKAGLDELGSRAKRRGVARDAMTGGAGTSADDQADDDGKAKAGAGTGADGGLDFDWAALPAGLWRDGREGVARWDHEEATGLPGTGGMGDVIGPRDGAGHAPGLADLGDDAEEKLSRKPGADDGMRLLLDQVKKTPLRDMATGEKLPEVEFDEAGFPNFDAERAMSLPSTREGAPANPVFAERLVPADQGSPALQPPPQYLPTLAPGTARGSHCTPLQRGRAEAGRRAGHVLKSRQPRSDWGPWSAQAQGPTPTREARLEIFHRH